MTIGHSQPTAVSAALSTLSNESPRNLSHLLQVLQDEIASTKAIVYENISSNYSQFTDTFRTANDMEGKVSTLYTELKQVMRAVDDTGIIQATDEHTRACSQLENSRRTLGVLQVLTALHSKLLESEKALSEGAYLQAARAIASMKKQLSLLPHSKVSEYSLSNEVTDTVGSGSGENNVSTPRNNLSTLNEKNSESNASLELHLFKVAYTQFRKRRNALRSSLEELLRIAVICKKNEIIVQPEIVTLPVRDIFSAFRVIGMHSEVLEYMVSDLSTNLLQPLIENSYSRNNNPNLNSIQSSWQRSQDQRDSIVFRLVPGNNNVRKDNNNTNCTSNEQGTQLDHKMSNTISVPFDNLLQLFTFLKNDVLGSDGEMVTAVGQGIFTALQPLLLKRMRHALPQSSSNLVSVQKVLKDQTTIFLSKLAKLGFLPSSMDLNTDNNNSTTAENNTATGTRKNHTNDIQTGSELLLFCENFEEHFADSRRNFLLSKARAIILDQSKVGKTLFVSERSDPSTLATTTHGTKMGESHENNNDLKNAYDLRSHDCDDTSLRNEKQKNMPINCFRLPTCLVSQAAVDIVRLAHSTLQEACNDCPPYSAGVLFRAARDMFDIFRSLCPLLMQRSAKQFHEGGRRNSLRLGVLFHNDCMYLSHHTMNIGHKYRDGLPLSLQSIATFVDLAPPLRALGEGALNGQLNFLGSQIKRVVTNLAKELATNETQPGLKNRLSIENLSKEAIQIVSNFVSVCIKSLPNGVFKRCVSILINMLATSIITMVIDLGIITPSQAKTISLVLESVISMGKKIETEIKVSLSSMRLTQWQPLVEMSGVVGEPFSSVRDAWEEGRLSSLGGKRTTSLISALFPPSHECQKLLDSISY